ncbi:CYFA0S12e02982g1_1 [Cyberlindnera fabianii]|uniref:CYFA0S12e02982g1_1 n=1 Tax=Cyberlindnera fabianii TaxID=36022 RepID=A0A061B712_CYBFA|nr:Histone acetyltransferase type B subunit 2 [Cyberlindnera fabianii]CDR43663.1 CYFA0S12e02982g1_1 [Cyberlindnera fabianii]
MAVHFDETADASAAANGKDATPEQQQEESRELTIQEEYQLWRKNCPVMYEFVSETALTWPSLTVQWLPDPLDTSDSAGIPQRLVIGTHTSGEDTDYLKVSSTVLPETLVNQTPSSKGKEAESEVVEKKTIQEIVDVKKEQTTNARLKVTKKFKHTLEVNRARHNPLAPATVATISGSGDVYLYDIDGDKKQKPTHLKHHKENGYGLSWNPLINGHLLTSSDDKTVALWDTLNNTTTPQMVFTNHTDIVNEVQWHNKNPHIFGSVSDDKTIRIWDSRNQASTQTIKRNAAINTISFSKFSSNLYAVGLEDSTIELFDLRRPTEKLHTIMGHTESISSLEWDPHNDGILASGSNDRRVILWDIKKIGEEQVQEDEDDGAPELFMMHAGHTAPVTDISFNPRIPFMVASTADDNIIHLWKISRKLTDEYSGRYVDEIDIFSLE